MEFLGPLCFKVEYKLKCSIFFRFHKARNLTFFKESEIFHWMRVLISENRRGNVDNYFCDCFADFAPKFPLFLHAPSPSRTCPSLFTAKIIAMGLKVDKVLQLKFLIQKVTDGELYFLQKDLWYGSECW